MIEKLTDQCKAVKLKILEMTASTGKNGAHIGGSFSAVELLVALLNSGDFNREGDRDRLVLSKGHGAMALYAALWQNGFMTEEELAGFDKNGTGLYGHPHRNPVKGLDFSGGSLGLGLSYAVGVAIGLKKKKSSHKVYVIVGDGECDEGIVWEALMCAANFQLNNLVVIVDRNRWQLDGETKGIMDSSDLALKFKSFGFETEEADGHDIGNLVDVLTRTASSEKPVAIIAETVKANGLSFLVGTKESHMCPLSEKKYLQAIDEINKEYADGK